ncbi:hypothetical protein Fcan01_19131 [Folsomia candida]|uniref:Uncharacterized protein n=1 Tax=Folsomia candida TaxID=158441 RepID=A0A226DMW8_FOLCA|nr:hypothetical protein Fcan01_19131 [Folsomia candida]
METATAYGGVRTISVKLWGRPEDLGFCLALFLSAIFDCGFAMMIFLQPDYSASVVNAMLKYWTGFCRSQNLNLVFRTVHPVGNRNLGNSPILGARPLPCLPKVAHLSLFLPSDCVSPPPVLRDWAGYLWMVFSVVSNLTLIGILVSIYVYIVYSVFHKEFLANCKTGYKSVPSLRQPGTLQVAYRGVEVLQKCVNLWIGPIIVPLQGIATQFSLSCNYLLITRMGKLDFPSLTLLLGWAGGCVTVWSAALFLGGYIWMKGRRVLNSWKHFDWPMEEKKMLNKFRRSCRPLSV